MVLHAPGENVFDHIFDGRIFDSQIENRQIGQIMKIRGKWAEIALLEPVRDYKARHASTLLTFDAVVDCLEQIERKSAAA